jgi:hypothetical protein
MTNWLWRLLEVRVHRKEHKRADLSRKRTFSGKQ